MSRIYVDSTFVLVLISVYLLLLLSGKALIALVPVRPILVQRRRFLILLDGIVVRGIFR